MRILRISALCTLTIVSVAAIGGCSAASDAPAGTAAGGPAVVATTSWQGAFAKAAGATDITVIAPSSSQHAAEYDPTPSDLTAVKNAGFVLYSDFESFAPQVTESAAADATTIEVNADNAPQNIVDEVARLGRTFGTEEASQKWIAQFEAAVAEIETQIREALGDRGDPPIVSQMYVTWLANMVSADVTTFGPSPLTAGDVLELAQRNPLLVLDNAHMSAGTVLPDSSAVQIQVANYPGDDLDLIGVFRSDAALVIGALSGQPITQAQVPGAHSSSGSHGH